jgi:hypothetical protein
MRIEKFIGCIIQTSDKERMVYNELKLKVKVIKIFVAGWGKLLSSQNVVRAVRVDG